MPSCDSHLCDLTTPALRNAHRERTSGSPGRGGKGHLSVDLVCANLQLRCISVVSIYRRFQM